MGPMPYVSFLLGIMSYQSRVYDTLSLLSVDCQNMFKGIFFTKKGVQLGQA